MAFEGEVRDQNGNRIFKEDDFERLFMIASLKRAGMTIKERIRLLTADMESRYLGHANSDSEQ